MSSFEFLFPQQSSDFTRLRNIRGAQLYPFYCFLNTTFETIMVLWCSHLGESIYYYQHLLFTTSERSKMFELEKAWDYRMIFWGQEPNHWDRWFQIPFLRLLFYHLQHGHQCFDVSLKTLINSFCSFENELHINSL